METLFLLIARGGSKSIPRKNLAKIRGLSLIGYKAISARQSKYCDRLIISTDDEVIREEAAQFGAEAPFIRPSELANDSATSDAVAAHAVEYLWEREGNAYDRIMLLEPTAPFAHPNDYDAAFSLMDDRQADFVTGITQSKDHTELCFRETPDHSLGELVNQIRKLASYRRQDLESRWTLNGAFYLMRMDYFQKAKTRYAAPDTSLGLPMPAERSVNIDEPLDLDFARFLAESGRIDLTPWKDYIS